MGAHCPTKRASWCRSNIFSIREVAIDAPAAHKNPSEGSFAVCSSMARATGPSLCSMGFVIKGTTKAIPVWIHLLDVIVEIGFLPSLKIPSLPFSILKDLHDDGSSETAESLNSEFAGASDTLKRVIVDPN